MCTKGSPDLIELVEDLTRQFAFQIVTDDGPALSHGFLSTLEWAFETLGWENPHPCPEQTCEHPGCIQWASCGTPTQDGYKRLCHTHFQEANR